MTLPASAAFRAAVTRSHAYGRELFVCRADGSIIEPVPMLPGTSVLVSSNLVRRTATIVLPATAAYIPRPGGLIWWDHPFRLRFMADGETMDLPLLWPDEPEHDVAGATVTLGCYDALRIVSADARLSSQATFPDGTSLGAAFRTLLVRAGAPDDDGGFDLVDRGATFSGDHIYEAGTLLAAVLGQWQVDHRLDLSVMPPATYTLRPVPDPLTTAPVATWARGREVRLLGMRKRWRNRAKNHAIVEGLSVDGEPFRVEVFDRNPSSPVRFGSPGVPDLFVEWQSDGITTAEQAEAVGRSLLVARAIEEEVEADLPVDPSLDRRDVVRIEDPATDTSGTFMLDSFPVPAGPGSHTITVRRERSLDP